MQAMRCIVKTFRCPPTGRIRDRNGGLPRFSDGAAHEDPLAYGGMPGAADTLLGAVQVVVVGKRGDRTTDALPQEVWRTSLPGRAVDAIAPGEALAESHRGKGQIDGIPAAYVCIGTFCSLPVTGRSELAASLKEIRAMRLVACIS